MESFSCVLPNYVEIDVHGKGIEERWNKNRKHNNQVKVIYYFKPTQFLIVFNLIKGYIYIFISDFSVYVCFGVNN